MVLILNYRINIWLCVWYHYLRNIEVICVILCISCDHKYLTCRPQWTIVSAIGHVVPKYIRTVKMISQLDSYKLRVWVRMSAHPLSASTRISCIIKWINWENLNMFVRQHRPMLERCCTDVRKGKTHIWHEMRPIEVTICTYTLQRCVCFWFWWYV